MIEFIGLWKYLIASNYCAIVNSHTLQFTTARAKSSIVFTRRRLTTDLNNALGLCAYVIAGWFPTGHSLVMTNSVSQDSQSYFATGGSPPISSSWRHAPWGHDQIVLQLNPCGYSSYESSSLTKGWVCLLWISFTFVKFAYRTCRVGLHGFGACLVSLGSGKSGKSHNLE
jgi:hypothetical protein